MNNWLLPGNKKIIPGEKGLLTLIKKNESPYPLRFHTGFGLQLD